MASAPVLADPSVMTAQERTNELVASVERDDLLAVLLVLGYCGEDEVNGRATPFGMSPLEAALLYPTTRTPVRQLIAECLLQRGATADHLVERMPAHALPAIESILKTWNSGRRDHAATSYDLCFNMDIYAVEEYLQEHGLGPDGPLDPMSTPAAPPAAPVALAPASPSPSPRRRPSPQPLESASTTHHDSASRDAPTSSRREGPSAPGPSSRDDRRRSESAHRLSRAESPRHEPLRRSRSPDRRHSRSQDARERRPSSPRLDHRRPPPRRERSPSPRRQYRNDSLERRSRSPPSASRSVRRGDVVGEQPSSALAAPISSHWITVGNMVLTIGERWLYERLDAADVAPSDMFLSKSQSKPLRFAFVGFGSSSAAAKAIKELEGLHVGGVKISATRFCDKRTGSSQPRISPADLLERRYIGAKAQSELASSERQRGLFILHLAPSVVEADVRRLLCRFLPATKVGYIEMGRSRFIRTAFVDIADDESCRKAIVECDGLVVNGCAIRVSWLERRNVWRPPRNAARFRSPPRNGLSSAFKSSTLQTPSKETLTADIDAASKPATSSRPDSAAPPSPSTAPRATPLLPIQAPLSARPSSYELDVDRLRTIGLSPEQVDAVEQMWRPVGSPDEQRAERCMDIKVDFGRVAQDDARLALALDDREPAFPDDPAIQARYTAFLEAQMGESRDYYTVFFAQLAEFNSLSAAFAERARAAAEEARRGSGSSMDVDERGVKQEERF
ncbi:hypothetical protein JCM9279_004563 [Rhodotorula babjevae]